MPSTSSTSSISSLPKLRSCLRRNSLPPTMSPPAIPPKSCLKRHSLPTSARPLFLDAHLDAPRAESPSAVFDSDDDSISQESESLCTAPTADGACQRPRAKSVSFREVDDVCVFYPVTDPLHLQARKHAVRIFKACADALKIDHPPPATAWRHSHSGYSECVLEDLDEETR